MIFRSLPDPVVVLGPGATDDVMAVNHVLDIPPEVLTVVFAHLDTRDLCDTIRVCKQFHALAEPFLYHDIAILTGTRCEALVWAFSRDVRRVKWVRSLLVSTKFGRDEGLHTLPPWIIEVSR